ncbi:class I SAM-dependent methyltransferase [Geodermatophilus sp. CPCC 206100]|uniref:class I SAM-dependent methyltransferase n=1 Tax=Geodermatophilus sp. CPCC 206100 TaxID=3020054 RepID=UPI003B009D74
MRAVDRGSYDELYRSAPAVWSGRPNRQLVVEGSALSPGTALDAGCGEGADALWLAERGWRVTAVDFSAVALERAAAHARARGLDDRITWVHADLDAWTPAEGGFDLVAAHYLHAHGPDRPALFARLAGGVAPGGTLLVVGHLLGEGAGVSRHAGDHPHRSHDSGDDEHPRPHEHDPDLLYTAADVAAVLDPAQWRDVVAETRDRDPAAVARTGNPAPDTVLVARRRSLAR